MNYIAKVIDTLEKVFNISIIQKYHFDTSDPFDSMQQLDIKFYSSSLGEIIDFHLRIPTEEEVVKNPDFARYCLKTTVEGFADAYRKLLQKRGVLYDVV